MSPLLLALIMGLIIAIMLGITRSREDNEKGIGAYIVKVLIVVCPIIYLGLTFFNNPGKIIGGGYASASIPSTLEMRTGLPDF